MDGYPGLTLDPVRRRVARFQERLGDPVPLSVEAVSEHVYRIVPAEPGRWTGPFPQNLYKRSACHAVESTCHAAIA